MAIVLLPAQDHKAILSEVPSPRTEFEEHRARSAEDQAFDLRKIAIIEKGRIQPEQKDRGEVLKALIAANGGKMLAKDAMQKMKLQARPGRKQACAAKAAFRQSCALAARTAQV